MKVITLDNHETVWTLSNSRYAMKDEEVCRSKFQFQVGQILKERFPYDTILEDVTLPRSRLSLDFFIPARRLAIEVQGEQHVAFNPHYHSSRIAFLAQQHRDHKKSLFCKLNNIDLLTFHSVEQARQYFKYDK